MCFRCNVIPRATGGGPRIWFCSKCIVYIYIHNIIIIYTPSQFTSIHRRASQDSWLQRPESCERFCPTGSLHKEVPNHPGVIGRPDSDGKMCCRYTQVSSTTERNIMLWIWSNWETPLQSFTFHMHSWQPFNGTSAQSVLRCLDESWFVAGGRMARAEPHIPPDDPAGQLHYQCS